MKDKFIYILIGIVFVLVGVLVFKIKNGNRTNEAVDMKVEKEDAQQFFSGLYHNEENNVSFIIPEDLKLQEPNHTKNYVSLYLSSIDVSNNYVEPPVIFVSFYQHTFEEERQSYLLNYGETAISENILHNKYSGIHIWGVNQEGPGYGQKNGAYIFNRDGKALSIRYLDQIYKPQAISILNSLKLE